VKPLLSRESGVREPTRGNSYEVNMAAMGASLDPLLRGIAAAIRSL
jgi:hypothetical protein